MTKSYDDSVKEKAREKLRDFIGENIFPDRRPTDVYVLCFPGAEQEGEEALEVKQVYDPLGIPRENVVGLEYDGERAQRLRAANLGIEIVEASDIEYLESCNRTFDVVSLDYTGVKNSRVIDAIRNLAGRQILGPLSVLSVNNFVGRENRDVQDYLRRIAAYNTRWKELYRQNPNASSSELARDLRKEHFSGDFDLGEARDIFAELVILVLQGGRTELKSEGDSFTRAIRCYPGSREIQDELERKIYERGRERVEVYGSTVAAHLDGFSGWISQQFLSLGFTEEGARTCASYVNLFLKGSYFVPSVERYSYRSNSGANMHLDIFLAKNLKRYFDRIRHNISLNGNAHFTLIDQKDAARFAKTLASIHKDPSGPKNGIGNVMDHEVIELPPERVHLGSSYTPRERITKEEAITLLEAGFTPEEIVDVFSGFKEGQLSAFKAHITRGTYSK